MLEKETPDEALEMSSHKMVIQDDVFEVETIKSAVKVRKKEDKKKERRKQFKSILKDLKVDLGKRSEKLKKEENKTKEVQVKRVKKAKNIVTDNSELFKQKKLVAKWKHFPMSRAMTRSYIPKVMKTIEPYWKMPLELDPSLEILVKLKISKSGRILDYEIVESSRNRFFNHSVRQVFKDLNQLPPLPEAFTGESTEIGLKFTSKQHNKE